MKVELTEVDIRNLLTLLSRVQLTGQEAPCLTALMVQLQQALPTDGARPTEALMAQEEEER
jgi:hypothetical protein